MNLYLGLSTRRLLVNYNWKIANAIRRGRLHLNELAELKFGGGIAPGGTIGPPIGGGGIGPPKPGGGRALPGGGIGTIGLPPIGGGGTGIPTLPGKRAPPCIPIFPPTIFPTGIGIGTGMGRWRPILPPIIGGGIIPPLGIGRGIIPPILGIGIIPGRGIIPGILPTIGGRGIIPGFPTIGGGIIPPFPTIGGGIIPPFPIMGGGIGRWIPIGMGLICAIGAEETSVNKTAAMVDTKRTLTKFSRPNAEIGDICLFVIAGFTSVLYARPVARDIEWGVQPGHRD